MDNIIEIDLDEPCVSPRRTPDQRAQDAVEQIGFEITSLRDAIRAGGTLSEQKLKNLAAMAEVMLRLSKCRLP